MATVSEEKTSEFDNALTQLDNRVQELGGLIVRFRDQLEPFLTPQYPQPPDAPAEDTAPPRAKVLDRLDTLNSAYVVRLRALEDILARLVV